MKKKTKQHQTRYIQNTCVAAADESDVTVRQPSGAAGRDHFRVGANTNLTINDHPLLLNDRWNYSAACFLVMSLFKPIPVKSVKLAEMIPNLSNETTFGLWLGNLFKMEVTCFSLYRHKIKHFATHTQNRSGDTENLHKLSSMKDYLHNNQNRTESIRFQKAHSVIRVLALLCVLMRTQTNKKKTIIHHEVLLLQHALGLNIWDLRK